MTQIAGQSGFLSRARALLMQRLTPRNSLLLLGGLLIMSGLVWPFNGATPISAESSAATTLTLPRADTTPQARAEAPPDANALRAAALTATPTPAPSAEPSNRTSPAPEWQTQTVKSGDNLAAVFQRAGLTARDVHDVVNTDETTQALTRVYPGDTIHLQVGNNGTLNALRYRLDETRTLYVERTADAGYTSRVATRPLERVITEATGVITSSLYNAAINAGLDDRLIMELAGIFGWDIDFALDIRRNDRFTVIFETLYRDGKKVRTGNILAAEFVNRGERFRALRYTKADGRSDYYSPDGRSMRKAFLRTPADFTRVSSEFNPNRVHPIYGTKRPHQGTDYAAPPGTPIKAAGDGKISHRGSKGGYGKTVILSHGTRYTTLYAHMRSYAKGQRTGDRVKQGEIIGYVGSTGASTGPHLHYEFRVDGVHRNPRTVDLPTAEPIAERYRADFERSTADWLAQLDQLHRTRLAQADD
ncbi:MAG: peptidoglycan DD-metalloendopeptidase family protein [Spiribacter sp.]|nr:peptidoglycan DD-metalloendopeptidase family protein [Spiribacter sp.]